MRSFRVDFSTRNENDSIAAPAELLDLLQERQLLIGNRVPLFDDDLTVWALITRSRSGITCQIEWSTVQFHGRFGPPRQDTSPRSSVG